MEFDARDGAGIRISAADLSTGNGGSDCGGVGDESQRRVARLLASALDALVDTGPLATSARCTRHRTVVRHR